MTGLAWALGFLLVLFAVAFLGFQARARLSPAPAARSRDLGALQVPAHLPHPIRKHFQRALGPRARRVESALIWGAGRIKVGPFWLPIAWRQSFDPHRGFRWEAEVQWYGIPVLRATDEYVDGRGRFSIAGRTSEGEGYDQAEGQRFWGELFWLPGALVAHTEVRWEGLDPLTARMFFPYGRGEDEVLLRLDPQTGLLAELESRRFKSEAEGFLPYHAFFSDYREFDGALVPARVQAAYGSEPYVEEMVEGLALNVDASL